MGILMQVRLSLYIGSMSGCGVAEILCLTANSLFAMKKITTGIRDTVQPPRLKGLVDASGTSARSSEKVTEIGYRIRCIGPEDPLHFPLSDFRAYPCLRGLFSLIISVAKMAAALNAVMTCSCSRNPLA